MLVPPPLVVVVVVDCVDEGSFSALADAKMELAALPVAVRRLAPLMRVSWAEAMSWFRALAIGWGGGRGGFSMGWWRRGEGKGEGRCGKGVGLGVECAKLSQCSDLGLRVKEGVHELPR